MLVGLSGKNFFVFSVNRINKLHLSNNEDFRYFMYLKVNACLLDFYDSCFAVNRSLKPGGKSFLKKVVFLIELFDYICLITISLGQHGLVAISILSSNKVIQSKISVGT